MPLLIQCPCGKKLHVRDEHADKKVKCPRCGQLLVASAPADEEPIDLSTAIVEEETPTLPRQKSLPPPSTSVKKPPPLPAVVGKKPPTLSEEEEDDEEFKDDLDEDDDDDKPAPYWVFPGTMSSEVMALAFEGLWFASLKGDALKKAEKLLKRGDLPGDALGKKAWLVPWESVQSIYCNQKLRSFTLHYHNDSKEDVYKKFKPADKILRDEIFDTFEMFLKPDWHLVTTNHTPITATFIPLGCLAVDVVITAILAVLADLFEDGPEVRNNWGGRASRGLAGIYNLLRDVGPFWISIIGLGVAFGLGIWLLVRILNPPIEVSIERRSETVDDEED